MCAAPMPATIYAILDAVSNLRTPVSWFRHVAAKLANCCISFHEKNLFHRKKKQNNVDPSRSLLKYFARRFRLHSAHVVG